MNKAELISNIAKKTNLTREQAEKALDATLASIADTLASGETVTLVGFGIFTPKQREQRMGRNPKTGEPALIEARKSLAFKPSKLLKAQLNA